MPDTITLDAGTKVKSGEDFYKLVNPLVAEGELVEPKPPQENGWKAYICPEIGCQALQKAQKKRKTLQVYRATLADCALFGVTPKCGICSTPTILKDPADALLMETP